MNRNRRFALTTLAVAATGLGLAYVPYAAGIRVNGTESLPPGIWRVVGAPGIASRGTIVNFCPPDSGPMRAARDRDYLHGGLCPGDYETLFKPVVAVAGDSVTVDADGVSVNGHRLPNSVAVGVDGAGQPMPTIAHRRYVVETGTVWVVSSYTPWSFDSRYFGPIATSSIRGEARPLWTRGTYGAFTP
jgi:conjugative transfer signal peptidase TraF